MIPGGFAMRGRKLRWVLALAGMAVAAATVVLLWLPRDPITRKNYDRIQKEMTRTEVEAILGPSGTNSIVLDRLNHEDFDTDGDIWAWGDYPLFEDDPSTGLWIGDAGIIAVHFEGGRAAVKGWSPRSPLLERLHHWLQRRFPDWE
jgi:hypothetical protein